jgi:hypothetical protein
MADPAYTPDHPGSSQLTHADQPEDDEIVYTPNRRAVIVATGAGRASALGKRTRPAGRPDAKT